MTQAFPPRRLGPRRLALYSIPANIVDAHYETSKAPRGERRGADAGDPGADRPIGGERTHCSLFTVEMAVRIVHENASVAVSHEWIPV